MLLQSIKITTFSTRFYCIWLLFWFSFHPDRRVKRLGILIYTIIDIEFNPTFPLKKKKNWVGIIRNKSQSQSCETQEVIKQESPSRTQSLAGDKSLRGHVFWWLWDLAVKITLPGRCTMSGGERQVGKRKDRNCWETNCFLVCETQVWTACQQFERLDFSFEINWFCLAGPKQMVVSHWKISHNILIKQCVL